MIGEAPDLNGQVCESLLAEEYWYEGELSSPANVVWIRISNAWHRLAIDNGVIFWRRSADSPKEYTMPELNAEVRIADIGKALRLTGELMVGYNARRISGGSEIEFGFGTGKRLLFRNVDDQTDYFVQ